MRKSAHVFMLVAAAAAVATGISGRLADARDRAEEQSKIDVPFVREILGSWDWASKAPKADEEKGSATFRLGLLETAVVEELEGTTMGSSFEGHGIWRISDDGATLVIWWFFSARSDPRTFKGTLAADGYDVRDDAGERITFKKTPEGQFEMNTYKGEELTRTVVFTKK